MQIAFLPNIIKLYTVKGRFEWFHSGCCVISSDWKPRWISGEIEQMIGNYKVKVHLVGRGTRNLATQNAKEPIDMIWVFIFVLENSITKISILVEISMNILESI